jgi:hypothetical protein
VKGQEKSTEDRLIIGPKESRLLAPAKATACQSSWKSAVTPADLNNLVHKLPAIKKDPVERKLELVTGKAKAKDSQACHNVRRCVSLIDQDL